MPFNSGNIATFSLNGSDISAYVTSVTVDLQRDIKDVKPIGGSAVSKVVGPYAGTVTLEGGYDPALDAIISPLFLATTPAAVAFVDRPAGAGGGTRAISGNCLVATWKVTQPGDDVVKWSSDLAVVGTVTDA
jgi:hypothetical protein